MVRRLFLVCFIHSRFAGEVYLLSYVITRAASSYSFVRPIPPIPDPLPSPVMQKLSKYKVMYIHNKLVHAIAARFCPPQKRGL